MPGSMFKRIINGAPGAGIVHQYHEADRSAAEYIEGVETLVQFGKFWWFEGSYLVEKLRGCEVGEEVKVEVKVDCWFLFVIIPVWEQIYALTTALLWSQYGFDMKSL